MESHPTINGDYVANGVFQPQLDPCDAPLDLDNVSETGSEGCYLEPTVRQLRREVARLRAVIGALRQELGTPGFWDGTIECQEKLLEFLRAMRNRQVPVVASQNN